MLRGCSMAWICWTTWFTSDGGDHFSDAACLDRASMSFAATLDHCLKKAGQAPFAGTFWLLLIERRGGWQLASIEGWYRLFDVAAPQAAKLDPGTSNRKAAPES